MSAVIIARGVDLAFKSLLSATYRDESAFVANAEESRDDDPWEVRSEHQNWTRELEKQSVVFDNIITQLLLPQIVEDEHNIRLLILGKDESIWADPRLDATLRQRLRAPVEQLDHPHTGYQTSYDIFRAKLRAIECSLDALGKELRNAKSFLRSSSLGEAEREKWRSGSKQREKLLSGLERCNCCLQDLLDLKGEAKSMIQALPPQQNGKRTKPQPWEFRQYAEDLYHLFSQAWCCDCRNQHHLKLRLKSCPSADLRFRVLFCFDKTQSRPTRPWNYQQVVFHMTEAEYESEPSAKVRFKGLTPQHLPHVEGSKITDFCGRLKKGRPKSDCIGFLQEGQKRYYVYQDPEGTAYLPMKAYPDEYSLATALTTGISEQFEMVDRWLLALDLVSSISQLCSTSWLNEEWSKDNIVYFNKGQNVGTLVWEEPYLSLNLPVQKKTPLIQESLSTGERMAIILLEICFNQPLEESKTYKEYLKCIGNNAKLHRLAAMMRLFEVSNETAKEVVDAIRWCLTKKTSIFSKRKEIWIQEFYKKVVEPLQSCCENLSNTYSTESMKVERQDRSINCELSRSSVLSHSPAKGRQSQIEDPNAQHHRHNLHITETDEDSYRGDTFTSRDPQTSSRPVMDDQNNSRRWDQFTIYSVAFMFLAFFFGLNFYWKIVSISVLATWLYCIFVFRKKHNGEQSDSRQTLPSRNCFTVWATWLARGFGLLLLLTWCALLSPIHIFTPTLLDAWTTYSDHPPLKSFDILYDPADAGIVDVFAIHGLGSNPSSAWRYRGNGTEVYWLRDILPKEKGFENIRVTMLNHQTRWDSHSPDIDFGVYAKMMLDDIEHLHQENRPIIFIAHSFGGLLLKKSLVLAITRSKRVAQMTRGILFLGVPHHGTKAAFIASLLACTAYWRGSSTTLLEYMSEGSPAVMTLDKEFYDIYARPSPTLGLDIPYICNFLEMKPERFGKLSLGPTVNIKSGSLRYAEDVLLDTDHRGLNKFQSSADPNFEKFLRHFTRAILHRNNH